MFLECILEPYEGNVRQLPRAMCEFLFNPEFAVNAYARMILRSEGLRSRMLSWRLQKKYAIYFSARASGGDGLLLVHYVGTVIGGVKIGSNCTIYQNVTIGQNGGRFPSIGDNVTVYSGAKIIGGVRVGNNSVIGANAVVIRDVPENAVVAGVPAKTIGYKEEDEGDYC